MELVQRVQIWKTLGGDPIGKEAELAGTYDMPQQQPQQGKTPGGEKAVIKKVAGAPSLFGVPVDVQGQEPPVSVQTKAAQHYALPDAAMYPLDDYRQVQTAVEYFKDQHSQMSPADKHEYCSNLVKRASALCIETDDLIEKYGSDSYAPLEDIQVCLEARIKNCDATFAGMYEKLAAQRAVVDPETFAEALELLDRSSGLTFNYGYIPDAYFTTFGKTASKLQEKTDPLESIVIGDEYITRRRLAQYLQNNVGSLTARFGADLASSLAKSPNTIFDSLPRDQKLILMRMANNDDKPVQQAPLG